MAQRYAFSQILLKFILCNGLYMIIFSLLMLLPYKSIYEQKMLNETTEITLTQSANPMISSLNYEQCKLLINEDSIHFLPDTDSKHMHDMYRTFRHNYPMYLYSYGGSGNTMTRLILEYITNIYTGSIYGDEGLYSIGFKGEAYACTNVLFVKHHPESGPKRFQKISKENLRGICHRKSRFGHQNIKWSNMSAVFIVRNPWKAVFSMYQYKFGNEDMGDSSVRVSDENGDHTRHLMRVDWNRTHFAQYLQFGIERLLKTFELMRMYDRFGYEYIIVKYENLVNLKDKGGIAMTETAKLLRYLYESGYYHKIENVLRMKMECIFRFLMKNDYQRFGLIHRKAANEDIHVTFEFAYQEMGKYYAQMLCDLWRKMKNDVGIFQYQMLDGMECRE